MKDEIFIHHGAGATSNMSDSIKRPALSYLLRLWAEDDDGRWVWRVSLTPILAKHEQGEQGSQLQGFASLTSAVVYLQAEMEKTVSEGEMKK